MKLKINLYSDKFQQDVSFTFGQVTTDMFIGHLKISFDNPNNIYIKSIPGYDDVYDLDQLTLFDILELNEKLTYLTESQSSLFNKVLDTTKSLLETMNRVFHCKSTFFSFNVTCYNLELYKDFHELSINARIGWALYEAGEVDMHHDLTLYFNFETFAKDFIESHDCIVLEDGLVEFT